MNISSWLLEKLPEDLMLALLNLSKDDQLEGFWFYTY
jgi:hypothetical protein